MVVWALTAGIGIYLLAVGLSAQRTAEAAPPTRAATAAVGSAALTRMLADEQPARPRPKPEGSPLLEFVHPALALLGLTFWIFYVMSGYRAFAWVAFGVVVATVAAGLGWEAFRRRTLRRRASTPGSDGTSFPPHLIMLHGFAAACTFALVVITAAAAR